MACHPEMLDKLVYQLFQIKLLQDVFYLVPLLLQNWETVTNLLQCLRRHADGTVAKAEPSYADLLSIAKPSRAVSLLFVVNASNGMLAGEAVFDEAQLRALDMCIKASVLQV